MNTNKTAAEIWKDEYNLMLTRMECIYEAFRFIVDNANPIFDGKVPTACVTFDQELKFLNLHINPTFWESSPSFEFRAFILAHESDHVFMDHGIRSRNLDSEISNIAQDIVINEKLAKYFFNKDEIDPDRHFCWYENCLEGIDYLPDQNFEYYYRLLLKHKDNLISKGFVLVGSHGIPSDEGGVPDGSGAPMAPYITKEQFDMLQEEMQECGVEAPAGSVAGSMTQYVDVERVPPKKKWESVIKKWTSSKIKKQDKELTHWVGSDRRHQFLRGDLSIPSTKEVRDILKEKDKIDVWFFQDTSGSCAGFSKRFFKAAKTIPEDKFNIRMFCFDTEVYETTLASGKLYGFGGTRFDILEYHIQRELKNKTLNRYPDAIFVITDGDGNSIRPAKPKNWHWFLAGSKTKRYIPAQSHTYNLDNFE